MNLKRKVQVILIFSTFFNQIFTLISPNSKAFIDIIEEYFIKPQISFDVSIITGSTKPPIESDIFLFHIQNSSYRLNTWTSTQRFGLYLSTIFFISSCEDFDLIHRNSWPVNQFPRKLRFLSYTKNCPLEIFQNHLDKLIPTQIIGNIPAPIEFFEFLLINDGNFIYFATIEWFTEVACNQPQLKILNFFSKFSQKWTKKLENYQKFRNFHSCSLTLYNIPFGIPTCWDVIGNHVNKNYVSAYGIVPKFFELLSKELNFIPLTNQVLDDSNVIFRVIRLWSFTDGWMHMTSTFLEARDLVVATPGELYSPYEKLWLPFDRTTWMLLLLTFLMTFLGIFVINLMPKFIQEQIYGKNIQTPVLNILVTFFGLAQHRLPVIHRPRIILILFTYFCLIFRTCYQSKMFEFMTSTPRKVSPMTIKDLKDKGYTMYANFDVDYLSNFTIEDKNLWPKINIINFNTYDNFLITQSQNTSAKLALIVEVNNLKFHEHFNTKSKRWHKLPEYSFQVSQVGFAFTVNHYLFEHANQIVQKLTSSGVMNSFIDICVKSRRDFVPKKTSMVLKLKNLSFGFVIWLGFCGISLTVFIFEILFWIFRRKIENFKKRNKKVKNKKVKFEKVHPINNIGLQIKQKILSETTIEEMFGEKVTKN